MPGHSNWEVRPTSYYQTVMNNACNRTGQAWLLFYPIRRWQKSSNRPFDLFFLIWHFVIHTTQYCHCKEYYENKSFHFKTGQQKFDRYNHFNTTLIKLLQTSSCIHQLNIINCFCQFLLLLKKQMKFFQKKKSHPTLYKTYQSFSDLGL